MRLLLLSLHSWLVLSCLLKPNAVNSYGDVQYVETDTESSLSQPENPAGAWTVIEPSAACLAALHEQFEGCQERQYGGQWFLLSPLAAKVLRPEGEANGSGCIIEIIDDDADDGESYFLLQADNKPFLQVPQGWGEPGESFLETVQREMEEELALRLDPAELHPVGYWTLLYSNALVTGAWRGTVICYYARLPFSRVAHLFPAGLRKDGITMVKVAEQEGFPVLDETEWLVALPKTMLKYTPDKIWLDEGRSIRFDGQNRKCLHDFTGITSPIQCRLPAHYEELKIANINSLIVS